MKSDLLVIKKIDLAPMVGASLEVMDRDARKMRNERPFVFSNLKTGQGLSDIIRFIETQGLLDSAAPIQEKEKGMSTARIAGGARLALALSSLSASSAALAHPGHPETAGWVAGLIHPFLGADHVLAMLAVGVWAALFAGRIVWTAPLAFLAAMIAGAGLGLSGVALPQTEFFIAASVLVLGLLVAFRVRLRLALMPLVAAFALFHGLAHGLEFQASAAGSAALFFVGFVLSTAALHALGIGVGGLLRGHAWGARLAGVPVALAGGLMLLGVA